MVFSGQNRDQMGSRVWMVQLPSPSRPPESHTGPPPGGLPLRRADSCAWCPPADREVGRKHAWPRAESMAWRKMKGFALVTWLRELREPIPSSPTQAPQSHGRPFRSDASAGVLLRRPRPRRPGASIAAAFRSGSSPSSSKANSTAPCFLWAMSINSRFDTRVRARRSGPSSAQFEPIPSRPVRSEPVA